MHFSNETFTELMKIKENKRCFDCNIKSCQWASINNGIFLCTNCSGIHRGLGVDKSYIRSILWDNWTENQLEFMKQGGNKNLKEFLLEYPYDIKQITPDKFYGSKIISYYRKLLKSKVDKTKFDVLPPSKEEAFEENEVINLNKENNFSSYGSIGQNITGDENKEINDDNSYMKTIGEKFNTVKNFLGKAVEGTKNTVGKWDLGSTLNNAKNAFFDTKNKIFESKPVNSFLNFFNFGNQENVEEKKETNNNNINNENLEKVDGNNDNNILDDNNINNAKNNDNNSNM